VNINGAAVTIDGNAWQTESAAQLTINGSAMSNPWMALSPPADPGRDAMLRDWKQHWALNAAMSGVPAGTYQVYLYVVQDWDEPNPQPVTFSLEGQAVGGYTPGTEGQWRRLGPFTILVADGTLNLTATGLANLSGIEVWRTGN
jgi:hypothetical protein